MEKLKEIETKIRKARRKAMIAKGRMDDLELFVSILEFQRKDIIKEMKK